jgi:hypothetical protein
VKYGTLPQVRCIVPDIRHGEHPPVNIQNGMWCVTGLINTVMRCVLTETSPRRFRPFADGRSHLPATRLKKPPPRHKSRIYFSERIRLKGTSHSDEARPAPLTRRPRVLRYFQPALDLCRTQGGSTGQTEFQRHLDAGPQSIEFTRPPDYVISDFP